MNDHDLPPHLRESNQPQRQIPLEVPELLDELPPVPKPDEKNDPPEDPFLRRS